MIPDGLYSTFGDTVSYVAADPNALDLGRQIQSAMDAIRLGGLWGEAAADALRAVAPEAPGSLFATMAASESVKMALSILTILLSILAIIRPMVYDTSSGLTQEQITQIVSEAVASTMVQPPGDHAANASSRRVQDRADRAPEARARETEKRKAKRKAARSARKRNR